MSTETESGIDRAHLRGVTVTAIAALFGVAAAVGSSVMTAGADPTVAANSQRALEVVLLAILVQPLLLKVVGLLKDDFGVKDFLFIAFMTFSMWFVSWGVLLSTGAEIAF
ncbi:hypothetical protein BRD00_06950 [Halobacteriales archaeon QS_8_69_26]|nr:MAG: hypothetical protein BRD00_06950 [Halobacteriales archaeon QS_8_69_26]